MEERSGWRDGDRGNPVPDQAASSAQAADPLHVFAYGSLIWRPGFPFEAREPGLLRGRHRALCVLSHHHRGTPERPGLVLGLDRGGTCRGVLYRVAPADRDEVIAYLRAREQVTGVYREVVAPVSRLDGSRAQALTYVVDRRHAQYARRLPLETLLAHVRQGRGVSGLNVDYVRSTYESLSALGVADRTLARLVAELGVASDGSDAA